MNPFLVLALACRVREGEDSAAPVEEAPAPWEGLVPIEGEAFHVLRRTPLRLDGEGELVTIPEVPSTAMLDRTAGTLVFLDAAYRHSPLKHCVSTSAWPDFPGVQGTCAKGEAQVERGTWNGLGRPLAVASDGRGWVVLTGTSLWTASADALAVDPQSILRFEESSAHGVAGLDAQARLAVSGTAVFVGEGTLIYEYQGGVTQGVADCGGPVGELVIVGGRPWALCGGRLFADGVDLGTATGIASAGNDAWVVRPTGVEVFRAGSSEGIEVAEGLLGPIAVDPETGDIAALRTGGVLRVAGGVAETLDIDGVVDVAWAGARELVVLDETGEVSVLVDSRYAVDDPLQIFVAGFFENPRRADQHPGCQGAEGMEALVSVFERNRAWLDDWPAAVGLGVTPQVVRSAEACVLGPTLGELVRGERMEVGVLFHETPEHCTAGDQSCYAQFLADEARALDAFTPGFTSGVGTHDEAGFDWVQGLLNAGVPRRFAFFGLSALPSISSADPRAKDAWPHEPSVGWHVRSAQDVLLAQPGDLALLPGNNVPGFALSGCANLFWNECRLEGQGGGTVFDEGDMEILDLLLHRAVVSHDGPGTFSWHLPALEIYDYTDGCSEEARVWSGEACEARVLQEWALDVHARLVLTGVASWTLPGDVTW